MAEADVTNRKPQDEVQALFEPQGVREEQTPRTDAEGHGERRPAAAPASPESAPPQAEAAPAPIEEPVVSPHPYATKLREQRLAREASGHARRDTLLYLDGVNKSFDGFKAINNLSLVVARGEMRAIIGPNGAGKTTMMDIITGKTRPDSGEVFFNGDVDLTHHDEAAIASMGIGRKFQKPTVFESHTVEDNIRLSLAGPRSVLEALFHRKDQAERDRIDEILETTRLTEKRKLLAASLSHGQKQWLEIGMLLAQDPELLLVDEPVAGMTDAETEETARLLREIARTRSVVVVEHDMSFVRELGVKVTCLHEGSVLAEGPLDQVSADPKVIEVYLGR